MKKYVFLMLATLLFCGACSDSDNGSGSNKTYSVTVELSYSTSISWDLSGVTVTMSDSNGTLYEATTDADGKAVFDLPIGIYEASASDKRAEEGYSYNYNGNTTSIIVTKNWTGESVITISMVESVAGQLIIKELYNGGCQKDDNSGTYQYDKYIMLYNNSDQTAEIDNLCLGFCYSYNAHATNNNYVSGVLSYAEEEYISALDGIWYLEKTFTLEPYSQAMIAVYGAIDHTLTYTNSVDLSNADYCTYDIDVYTSTSYYSSPSEKISTDCYFKAYKLGKSTAWALSINSPAFYIFSTGDTDPLTYASNSSNWFYPSGYEGNATYCQLKVLKEWVLDGIEVFLSGRESDSKKRLTSDIDGGYVSMTNGYGHTLYRNVDKDATEAIEGNSDKLVYDYAYGSDPSRIDAEASIANGATIIYQDTNNSTEDFHERSQSSLRD